MNYFIETAFKGALAPGLPEPTILWFTQGRPAFGDLAILARGLLIGQTVRVVSDSQTIEPEIEAFCATHGLNIIFHSGEMSCWRTLGHCYFHNYFDLQLA